MLGMCAVGTPAKPVSWSLRRVHSPAAINAAASSPPRKIRTPGPISPASIENCTRKMPPSASARPPIHTTQLAPKRSSKLLPGSAGSDGGGGGAAAFDVSEPKLSKAASIMRSAGEVATGLGACCSGATNGRPAEAGGSGAVSDGAGAMPVSCATRNSKSVTRLRIFNTKMSATIASTAAKNSIKLPQPKTRRRLPALSLVAVSACSVHASPRPSEARAGTHSHRHLESSPGRGLWIPGLAALARDDRLLPPAEAQPRRRALGEHLAAETELRGRPPAGGGRGLAGRLDQCGAFDEAAEVRLGQQPPRDRLDGVLQFGERELGRHQLEHHRTVFQLRAQPRDRGRQYAAVVEAHRFAQRGQFVARARRGAAVAPRLLDQARLVEHLVAVEHLLLVPRRAAGAEAQPQPLAPAERTAELAMRWSGPFAQGWDDVVEDGGALPAPVLPRKETIPRLATRAAGLQRGRALDAGEREITDGNHVRDIGRSRMAAAVAEGVKLLDIADAQPGLRLDPFAQPDLEGAMRQRIERAERQAGARVGFSAVARDENGRLAFLHGDDRGGEPDFDRRERRVGHDLVYSLPRLRG